MRSLDFNQMEKMEGGGSAAFGAVAGAWTVALSIVCPPAGIAFALGAGYLTSKACASGSNWFA